MSINYRKRELLSASDENSMFKKSKTLEQAREQDEEKPSSPLTNLLFKQNSASSDHLASGSPR